MQLGGAKTLQKIQDGEVPKFGPGDDTIGKKAAKLLGLHPDEKKQQEFEEYMKKFKTLKQDEDGTGMIVQGPNGRQYEISGGAINMTCNAPLDSEEFILSQIELAVMAKKTFGDEPLLGHAATDHGPNAQLMMEKIGGMVGLTFAEKSDKKLENVDKALAEKIDKVWAENAERLGLAKPQGPAPVEMQAQGPAIPLAAPGR